MDKSKRHVSHTRYGQKPQKINDDDRVVFWSPQCVRHTSLWYSHARRTRHKHPHIFKEHAGRIEGMRFSFTNRTIIEWNDLPALVAEAGSLDSFKSQLAVQLGWAALTWALWALLPAIYLTRTRTRNHHTNVTPMSSYTGRFSVT